MQSAEHGVRNVGYRPISALDRRPDGCHGEGAKSAKGTSGVPVSDLNLPTPDFQNGSPNSAICTWHLLVALVRQKRGAHRHGDPRSGFLVRAGRFAHQRRFEAAGVEQESAEETERDQLLAPSAASCSRSGSARRLPALDSGHGTLESTVGRFRAQDSRLKPGPWHTRAKKTARHSGMPGGFRGTRTTGGGAEFLTLRACLQIRGSVCQEEAGCDGTFR